MHTSLKHIECSNKSMFLLEIVCRALKKAKHLNLRHLVNTDGKVLIYEVDGNSRDKEISHNYRFTSVQLRAHTGITSITYISIFSHTKTGQCHCQ